MPRGKDLKPRKKRQSLISTIKSIASKIKKDKTDESWKFDFGESEDDKKPPKPLGRHVFKNEVEINLKDL